MAYSKLNIVRDCWWANPPSGLLSDETGKGSTYEHGLYKSLNPSTSSYIMFRPSGTQVTQTYRARVDSTNIVPEYLQVNLTTSGDLNSGTTCYLKMNGYLVSTLNLAASHIYANNTDYTTIDEWHKEHIYAGRTNDNYDYIELLVLKNDNATMKIYDIEIVVSGTQTWDNHTFGLPNVVSRYAYPNQLKYRAGSSWVNQNGTPVNASGYYHINMSPSGVGSDNTYIRHVCLPSSGIDFTSATQAYMPKGGLSLVFDINNPEMLTNGNFDNGLTGWTNMSWDTAEISSGNLHLVTDGTPNYACIYQAINVIVGQRYRLRCHKQNTQGYVKVGQSVGGASLDNGYIDTYAATAYKDYVFIPVVSPAYVMFVDGTAPLDTTIYDISVTLDNPESLTQLTRAQLMLRMSLPPSGQYENARDTFEINGYNYLFKEQDHKDEMPEAIGSNPSKKSLKGYYVYGAGQIVEQSGFKNYTTELNFLDPYFTTTDEPWTPEHENSLNSLPSTRYRNIDIFNNMEFQLVGLPSGTLISSAQLYLEYIPNDVCPLYTVGGQALARVTRESYVDVGGDYNPLFGDGGWNHRGNLHEGAIFEAFYKFDEASGTTTTPVSLHANFASGVYGDYINALYEYPVYDNNGILTSITYDTVPVEPQRRNYYRNPVRTEFGELYDPTYYRDMIYNGSPFLPFDIHNPNASRYAPDIAQVYFEDRISLNTDFTLYFMLYRESTNQGQNFAQFFQRGMIGSAGTVQFEIMGLLETEAVTFVVQNINGSTFQVSVPIPAYSLQPILIWFTCKYDTVLAKTTLKLAVHTDIKNYFASDWIYAEKSFSFPRKQYIGAHTMLGPLYTPSDLDQQLAFSSFFSYVSLCEFGWANTAHELEWETTDLGVRSDYDMSTDIEKRFFASRLCNSPYLLNRLGDVNLIGGLPDNDWTVSSSGWNSPLDCWYYTNEEYPWSSPIGIYNRGDGLTSSKWIQFVVGSTKQRTDHPMLANGFGFNIPSGDRIIGCEARVWVRSRPQNGWHVGTSLVCLALDDSANNYYIRKGTNQSHTGPQEWPRSDTVFTPLTYGGTTNMWGMTSGVLTPALVNDPRFGVVIDPHMYNEYGFWNDTTPTLCYLDHVELKIYTESQTYGIDDYMHVDWQVPNGSGAAQYSTQYVIDSWTEGDVHLYNPISTAGTHHLVHPSAIYIEFTAEHTTNHPSGSNVVCDFEFDSGSNDNWKVARVELTIPSGTLRTTQAGIIKHINMNSEPINYGDVSQLALTLTTKYVDIGSQEYFGDLKITSIKVYFDSYAASATGNIWMPLFVEGGVHKPIDLFIEGHLTADNFPMYKLDLYIDGAPHLSSGQMPLYTGGVYTANDYNTTLYISGVPFYGSGQMPLFIKSNTFEDATLFIEGLIPPSSITDLSLFTYATPAGVGGLYKMADLYMDVSPTNQSISLYVYNSDMNYYNRDIPLYLEAAPIPSKTMDLFMLGPSGQNNTTYLYVRGLGTTDGAFVNSGRIPLFIARSTESIDAQLSLYLAQKQDVNTTDLYVKGNSVVPSSINLYMYGSGLPTNDRVKLYTHGF